MSEKIIERNLLKQHNEDMQTYAIYTARERVLPDYRDGLKPVHRKIIFCVYNDFHALTANVKSASIVGRILEKYHPHGDTGTYGAMKPMANWFEINKPLLDKQGNFGNVGGDGAAAMRYTEARLSKFALDCLISELQESYNSVDWEDNYDGKYRVPIFLPAAVPLLLINGAFGIAVGLKVEIPRHNINEVIDATLNLLHNPNASVVLVPDHCMPCEIIQSNFKAISNKGSGSYKVRGVMEPTQFKGKPALHIKSLPDMTFAKSILAKIEEMVDEKKLIQVQEIIDNTKLGKSEYYIVLKPGADVNYVKDVIYNNTEMQQTKRVNFEVLKDKTPVRMSYKAYLLDFLEFRKDTKFRMYYNRLQNTQTRIHEMELYIKVLQSGEIDNIIHMIRNRMTTDDSELIIYLVNKLKVTPPQAKFLITTDIRKLSKGYLNKYIENSKALRITADMYQNKLIDESEIIKDIEAELIEFKKKYGNRRRCTIISEGEASGIPEGEFKVVITHGNCVKKVPVNDSIGSFRGDAPKLIIKAYNTESIIIFDELGKVFKLPVHKIMFCDRNSNGIDIRTLIKNLTSNINSVMYEPTLKEFAKKLDKFFITVITTNGYIKKMDIADFLTVPPSGILYTKLEQGDFVKDIMVVGEHADIMVYSHSKVLRMNMAEVPYLKRNTKGNRAMSTDEQIDGISVIRATTTDIVVVTETGRVNRFSVLALPLSARGRAGSKVIKMSKGDSIKAIYGLNIKDSIRIITTGDKITLKVEEIPEGSSISQGVKMLSTKSDKLIRCDILKNT